MILLKIFITLIPIAFSGTLYDNAQNARQILALYPQVSMNFMSTCLDCTSFGKTKANACKNNKGDEISNFLRHLCWQANLTYWYGEAVAKGIGDIHEGIVINDKMSRTAELDGCIDQANNRRGRRVGKDAILGLTGLKLLNYSAVMTYIQEEILRSYSDYCLGQPKTICPKRLEVPERTKSKTIEHN